MSDKYFVRIRGRIQGPFSSDKVKQLVSRGQISRSHEVSTDGTTWRRASEFVDLFEHPTSIATTSEKESEPERGADREQAESKQNADASSVAPPPEWYYAVGTPQKGPINYETLQHLFRTGQLPPDTDVWGVGMTDWVPASTLSGLVPGSKAGDSFAGQPYTGAAQPGSNDEYDSRRLVPLLKSMRLWTMLVGIVGLISCLIQFVRAIVNIVADNGIVGLLEFVTALTWGAAAMFLLVFSVRAGKFLEERSERKLITAFRAMQGFWIYTGVLVCIGLSVLLVLISLAMAGMDQALLNNTNW